jgi:Domain of unknown function (DUF6602)
MPRHADSARIDLAEVFRRLQREMLAQLSVGGLFEHASAAGAASEHHWLDLFDRYLPKRYRAAPAFVIDSDGRRSRQIDLAIFDNLYSPPLFPHPSGLHLPAESVYAVFEVKPSFSRQWLRDAHEKAASVRALRRTSVPILDAGRRRSALRPRPILAGLLAATSVWTPPAFASNLRRALASTPLDLGCCLEHGAFDRDRISSPDDALIFFILRLLDRLREMGSTPAPDWTKYFPACSSLPAACGARTRACRVETRLDARCVAPHRPHP